MGYDLCLLYIPDRMEPQLRKHRELSYRVDELIERPPDDPELASAREALKGSPDPRYCKLNLSAMVTVRALMEAAGMLATEGARPEFPSLERVQHLTLDGQQFHPELYFPHEVCTPEQVAFMDAVQQQRRYRPEGSVGVQWWKLQSNDYWIVTAEECSEAVSRWESLGPDRRRELLEEFAGLHLDNTINWLDEFRDTFGPSLEAIERGSVAGHSDPVAVESVEIPDGPDHLVTLWAKWLAYLHLGAESSGFMVE